MDTSSKLRGISIGSIVSLNDDYQKDDTTSNPNNISYDSSWFDLRFMPPNSHMHPRDVLNRFDTTAKRKMTSTALGRSYCINPVPQFGRNADVRHGNRAYQPGFVHTGRLLDCGMGRAYSENYDDSQQLVMFQFGKEKFNSIPNFLFSAIDSVDSYIAKTGKFPVAREAGKWIGVGISGIAFPFITLTIWSLKLISGIVLGTDQFKYYYLDPRMHLYWTAVNTLVTSAATELGILIPELMPSEQDLLNKVGVPYKMNMEDFRAYSDYLPGLISEKNYIDVFAIACGPQTVANRVTYAEYERDKKYDNDNKDEKDAYAEVLANPAKFMGYVFKEGVNQKDPNSSNGVIPFLNYNLSFSNFLERMTTGFGLFSNSEEEPASEPDEKLINEMKNGYAKDDNGLDSVLRPETGYWKKMAEAADAGIKEGGGYAVFRVNYVGSSTESFSNSTGKIATGTTMNSVAAGVRDLRFNLMDGNFGTGVVEDFAKGVKDFTGGLIEGITAGASTVVQTILGNAYVDIQDKWESSEMSYPTHTYTMNLRSLYNTPFSILKDEIIPLCMILCGVLPLSAGQASHSSPFICEFFSKGVAHFNPGIITNVSVSRGVSNLGMDKNKRYRGIDVTFTVADLTNIMTAPVNASIFGNFSVALEDNKPINKYLATIASRDLLTNKYMKPKIKIRLSRFLMAWDQMVSPTSIGLRGGLWLENVLGGIVADHGFSMSELNATQ